MVASAFKRIKKSGHPWRKINFSELSELYISSLLRTLAHSMVGIFIPVYLVANGFSVAAVIFYFAMFYGFGLVGVNEVTGRLIARFGPKHIIGSSFFLQIFFFVLLASQPSHHWPLWVLALTARIASCAYYMPRHISFSKIKHKDRGGKELGLLEAAAKTGKWVNVKKGQFLAPADCKHIKEKIRECGSEKYLVTERGASFGYNNLVFDLRVIPILHSMDIPVIFDGTHSAQLPGGAGNITGGQREFIPDLMTGAVSLGIEGLFMEVQPDPPSAKSDSTTQFYLNKTERLLTNLLKIDRLVKTGLVELD